MRAGCPQRGILNRLHALGTACWQRAIKQQLRGDEPAVSQQAQVHSMLQ